MTTEEPEALYGPGLAATTALSTLIGVTIGILRIKGLLDRDDAGAIFTLADSILPEGSTPLGTQVISLAKIAADKITE